MGWFIGVDLITLLRDVFHIDLMTDAFFGGFAGYTSRVQFGMDDLFFPLVHQVLQVLHQLFTRQVYNQVKAPIGRLYQLPFFFA